MDRGEWAEEGGGASRKREREREEGEKIVIDIVVTPRDAPVTITTFSAIPSEWTNHRNEHVYCTSFRM